MRIGVDAGHGGEDPGAVGPSGLRECDVALSMATLVMMGLHEGGHDVVMTRTTDVTTSLAARVEKAKQEEVDYFISLHANAAAVAAAGGFEVFTSPGYSQADPLATSIFHQVRQRFPALRARVDTADNDPDKEARFYVLVQQPAPAVLVETAFISNAIEEAKLADPGWRMAMAGAVVSGTLAHLRGTQ